jgi:L-amino acid N-acyltransferase YncA
MTLHIRNAHPSDIPAITAIYAREVLEGTATFELCPPDENEMRTRYETLIRAGYPYFVAEYAGQLTGYAYAGPFRPRPAYRFTVEDSIYMAPLFQRRGIGQRLMHTLIETCEQRGFRQMIAVIGDSQSLGSIALHKRMGFTPAATLLSTGFKLGAWRDTVLMQRTLGEGGMSFPPED